jgi:alpha-ketoglutarate-dependent taurine dioxygenase
MMLAETAADPRAWRADTVDAPETWYYPLSDQPLAALDRIIRDPKLSDRPIAELQATGELRAACANEIGRVAEALEKGRGFAVISLPPERYSAKEQSAAYWLVGQMLGRPFEQNVQGTVLYDVKDTGQSVQYGARFSVTNAESTFHTDNSFGDTVVDYVGLLCINPAKSGGESQIVSGFAVRNELRANQSDAVAILRKPFHVDRRGGLRPGDAPTARFPIFGGDDHDLLVRYLRYWIEVGHEKAGQPLSAEQVTALDALDRVAAEPMLRVQFMMKPGEMLFINNRWILHNRTGFEDHTEVEKKRHYVRLWLTKT